jgi:hypothetical protein
MQPSAGSALLMVFPMPFPRRLIWVVRPSYEDPLQLKPLLASDLYALYTFKLAFHIIK